MIVRIKRGADGTSSLTCERPDGGTTWTTCTEHQARFFPRGELFSARERIAPGETLELVFPEAP